MTTWRDRLPGRQSESRSTAFGPRLGLATPQTRLERGFEIVFLFPAAPTFVRLSLCDSLSSDPGSSLQSLACTKTPLVRIFIRLARPTC